MQMTIPLTPLLHTVAHMQGDNAYWRCTISGATDNMQIEKQIGTHLLAIRVHDHDLANKFSCVVILVLLKHQAGGISDQVADSRGG